MAANPTVFDLWRAGRITDYDIDAAIDAYLADPKAEWFRFACGDEVDVAAAVEADLPARAAVADPDRSSKFKRTVVRAAILLAHPVKG